MSNKAHQYAAGGRWATFSLRQRLPYEGAVVRWYYTSRSIPIEAI